MKKNTYLLCTFFLLLVSFSSCLYADDGVSQDITSNDITIASSSDVFSLSYTNKKKVAIFLDAPLTYANNETVRKLVPDKAAKLFEETNLNVIPFDDSMLVLRTYLEDNRMIINEYYTQPLNREDIGKISKELGADYAFLIKISNSAPRASSFLFTVTFKTTVTCDVRLLDNATNKYIVSKSIVKDGSTTSIAILGMPDFNTAYTDALKKALDELNIDRDKLKNTIE